MADIRLAEMKKKFKITGQKHNNYSCPHSVGSCNCYVIVMYCMLLLCYVM